MAAVPVSHPNPDEGALGLSHLGTEDGTDLGTPDKVSELSPMRKFRVSRITGQAEQPDFRLASVRHAFGSDDVKERLPLSSLAGMNQQWWPE